MLNIISKEIFQMSPVNWVTDTRTGKQYLVLDTDHLVHDDLQQVCHNIGGFLPEPRDERENQFLDSLATDMFTLGMSDKLVEGEWVWDSDGSPVTWFRWIGQPGGGTKENFALMVRKQFSDYAGYTSDGWLDYTTIANSRLRREPKSLICERPPGM